MTIEVIREKNWTFKLLPQALRQLNIEPQGVIHVGAHWGQEVPVYLQCGFSRIVLIEPDPESCEKIAQQDWFHENKITLLPLAIAEKGGTADFYQVRTGNGVWSGLKRNPDRADPDQILQVPTATLAVIQTEFPANVLVIDTQGTELQALQSADLSKAELVIIETQVDGVDGAHPAELYNYAESMDWEPVIIWDRTGGWTDTLLIPRR